ncbi:glutamyl-tRNA synthetase [Beggiatoa alba B18LD]|uniref:Glutamate--tRNA ligase n=1 Tax=Beggiatoa alba B18LD TaxID=395493 RepID=I3CC40_9GAMM|nr:glutamate--tRNA ligase [Beggiatoa alba]EIJ41183.1 glutamyl-tRNA synthetase [Beggiatoa alba B18LD]
MTVRTRFAPSPTGYLHVGGVRTALYSWLYARQHQGEFILRIEDTDRERSTEEAVQVILEGMAWCGLNHDGDVPRQTQRFDRYKQVIQQLLDEGKAYYCYCSKEEVEQMRAEQMARKEKPRYNGYWRDRQETPPADVQPVVRFKNPLSGNVVFDDMIKGQISVSNEELDDLIIARADGTPTYNFCVVVDDWDMGITHVIRGDDHVNNTPRQINILQALGAQIPKYAHVPMILGNDGQRLSKRHGAVSVMNYKEDGFLPEALLNYLIRLGWANGDQEIFSIEDMLQLFKIENVNSAPSAFNTDKLLWLNQHYIKTGNPERIAEHLAYQFQLLGIDANNGVALPRVVTALAERAKTLREMAESSRMFYVELVDYDTTAVQKHLTADTKTTLSTLCEQFATLTTWQAEPIHAVIHAVSEQLGLKMGKVAQPLRVAVTGGTVSPSIDITLALIGQERTLKRLQQAIGLIVV